MKIKSITKIEPHPSRCIEVDSPDRLFAAGGDDGQSVVSHNSVAQRNIIVGCIMRPNNWRFIGIDLKKVELSAFRKYSNVVLGIATTLEDALTCLRFAQETMMKRYAEMEQLGINNFLDLPQESPALLVMVDEAGELLSPSGVKALAETTLVVTPDGSKLLKDIEVGDSVLDSNSQVTTVTRKYEPEDQSRYTLSITRDSDLKKESFVAGSEHFWVAYFKSPDGQLTGPSVVDTQYLYEFKKLQDSLPVEQRTTVKFKKNC